MNIGETVSTPRFLVVRINAVFETKSEAYDNGYTEPTHYSDSKGYEVLGKHLEKNKMIFAGIKK